MEAGSEAYAAALTVYSYLKNTAPGAALELVADDLGRRFARKSRQTSTKTPAETPANPAPASSEKKPTE